ncbi:MAG: ATP-binding protein [Planctomycetota bacterium]
MIERTFRDIPDGKLSEADQHFSLGSLDWSRGTTWKDLLRSKRVLIISEAGAGKTYECRKQAKCLWENGEPSFFVELSALASEGLLSPLSYAEEERFTAWQSAQSDVATFFLDSIDELKLSRGSFEQALKRLSKGIAGQLHRARIIITTRPIPFDEKIARHYLPVPPEPSTKPTEDLFADIAMRAYPDVQGDNQKVDAPVSWTTVALMPLSDAQILEFAKDQKVENAVQLLEDLQRRNAQEFARRPQDLIELCVDWREHKRIRTHRDQMATNVRVKLLPRSDRKEPAELSSDKAVEGAMRLALAMLVTRRFTIRHSANDVTIDENSALDPARFLSDWSLDERKALLERPLFGFASYGRVRFHHRSIAEYLASERLFSLHKKGMPLRALKRLLFAETKGKMIARPSKRPVAAWLALKVDGIFEFLRDNEPAVLLNEGDPESLSPHKRRQALSAYVDCYGRGGWRRLSVPIIQAQRFASSELAQEINRAWQKGVENPEVREMLMHLIEFGGILECADLAHEVAIDRDSSTMERLGAIDAMAAVDDDRLTAIALEVAAASNLWSDPVGTGASLLLFPRHMTVQHLCQTFSRTTREAAGIGDASWRLSRVISEAELDSKALELLRDGLTNLISIDLNWCDETSRITSSMAHLSRALAATCIHGLAESNTNVWLRASTLALRVNHRAHGNDEPHKSLRKLLGDIDGEVNERLFWATDSFVRELRDITDPWDRYAEITLHDAPVEIRADRDLIWISNTLSDETCNSDERAILLETAIRISPGPEERRENAKRLRQFVADQPGLLEKVDSWIEPSKYDVENRRHEKDLADQQEKQERQKAKAHESWLGFRLDVATHPEIAFSSDRSHQTAWNLWQAMRRAGDDSLTTGWNRQFIEEHFDQATANRLRSIMMTFWRKERPTLPSERSPSERNTIQVRWQFGLAAIYAESEDAKWAKNLSEIEANLASRFALIEWDGLPRWMTSLVAAHPAEVDATLGCELTSDLANFAACNHSGLLRDIHAGPSAVASVFSDRLKAWIDPVGDQANKEDNPKAVADRVLLVAKTLIKHGTNSAQEHLAETASRRLRGALPDELVFAWLRVLMRIEPDQGIPSLEHAVDRVEPAQHSEAVVLIAALFGNTDDEIGIREVNFDAKQLLRLLRLTYRHVRLEDDATRAGTSTRDIRSNAERVRNDILTALFRSKGNEAWAAKQELAEDPVFAHLKDRILKVADEVWAEELDETAFDDEQAIALDCLGEAPPTTNETMFAVLRDRLSDLDDLLLLDSSPREAWARLQNEKLTRREIARELKHAANGAYKVDQEAVTADEKETDIRLRSTHSDLEAVIELKLAENYSGRVLRDTIENQLVGKYMAAKNCRSGALLMTLSKDKMWRHPDDNSPLDVPQLMSMLRNESQRVQKLFDGTIELVIHLLDLRPRLPKESCSDLQNDDS